MAEDSISSISTGNAVPGLNAGIIPASLISFLRYVIGKWWLFLIVGILAGIAGFFYAKMQKTIYQSRLTFALDDSGEGLSGAMSLAAQFGLTVGGSSNIFAGDNIIEILKSRTIVEKVLLSVDTFNNKPFTLIDYFRKLKDMTDPAAKEVPFPPGLQKSSLSYHQDSVLYNTYLYFIKNVIAAGKPDRKLGIYEVNVSVSDEKLAKVFTDRLVAETNRLYIDICSSKAKKTLDVLEERVASMKGNLSASLSNKASSQDANINPAFAASQVPILRQQANIQAYGGAYGELFKNLEMARLQYLNKIPVMQIIDPAAYPMKKIRKSKLITGLIFGVVSSVILLFIFWLKRLRQMMHSKPVVVTDQAGPA